MKNLKWYNINPWSVFIGWLLNENNIKHVQYRVNVLFIVYEWDWLIDPSSVVLMHTVIRFTRILMLWFNKKKWIGFVS